MVARSVGRAWVIVAGFISRSGVIVAGSVIVTGIQGTRSAVIFAVVTSVDRGQTQGSEEDQYLHCVMYPL